MLYLLQVYTLVVIVVALPVLLLFIVAVTARLGLAAIRFMIRRVKSASEFRDGFAKQHWGSLHR